MIKDSGERQVFSTGAVRDISEGKGRCDLLPLDVANEIIGESNQKYFFLNNLDVFMRDHSERSILNAVWQFIEECGYDDRETALLEASIHYEEGMRKYKLDNWKKGINTRSYIDSAVRHYLKWRRGDADERHDRAVLWNLMCCIWTLRHKPEMMDIGGGK